VRISLPSQTELQRADHGDSRKTSSISLVVPTFKERLNIPELVERTRKVLAVCSEDFELIIVDDVSPDGTGDEVRRLQDDRPWLKLLVRKNEHDLSTAVIAGWRIATGEILASMDGDFQHPPELLPMLYRRMRKTAAGIVAGSRHATGGGVSDWSPVRRLISWVATLMATTILPGTLRKVLDPISWFGDRYSNMRL
jgi:dolichol-phosphate mannosyltransferase